MSKKHSSYDPIDTPSTPAPDAAPPAMVQVLPPEQRAKELLGALTAAQHHSSPVTLWMIDELRELIGEFTGVTPPKPVHAIRDSRGHSSDVTFKGPDGALQVIDTIEEALAYVRNLPIEKQQQMHWRAADKALAEAMTFVQGADVSPAVRTFETAVKEDAKLNPPAVTVPERDPSLDPPKPAPEPEPAHA